MSDELTTYDRDAERAVLAACLESKHHRNEARKFISGADFGDARHERIWDAMSDLDRNKRGVDPTTLMAVLDTGSKAMLPDIVTSQALPDNLDTHARIVRNWAIRRRLHGLGQQVVATALNPTSNAESLAASVATKFANLRDTGITDDIEAVTLAELLAEADDEPDWLIPDLLERRDRLMLTGVEGLGKSYLLRQIAIMAAWGLHPFANYRIAPQSVTIIDVENSRSQVRRKVRPVVEYAQRHGTDNPAGVSFVCTSRMDITRDKDLARIHRELDATQPDLVVIGPLYRLVPRALQSDDEASPLLAALDTIRDRDITLLMEAHAGHAVGKGGERDLRPRGSSALLGWPEFGYGMRQVAGGIADLVPWRGDREKRHWPDRIKHDGAGIRWVPMDEARTPWSPTAGIA